MMAAKNGPPNGLPSAAEVGQLRAWLATHGVPPAVANDLVKMTRTRQDNADLIREYCKGLTK
jgi:hypothetical protein